uniref:Ig-like domain-containing protein n=1 Tax=Lates calcarifer TaxID=8187 RepID=A0A4W6FGT2_LATCA
TMTTKRQLGWQKLFLILTGSLQVSIPQPEYKVARGNDITLTCSFVPAQPHITTLILKWEAFSDIDAVATYFTNAPTDIAPAYEGRASLEVDLTNHVSTLQLKKVTMQDNRSFQCSVIIPGDDEGTTAATTSLLVLVAPSAPICRIQGKAEYWHDISLTCMSEEGSPKPTYDWKSYSVQNVPRQLPPKATDSILLKSLFPITQSQGFYICTSKNPIASASCNLTLAVMPGGMNEASFAGIIGGVVAGLLLLGILIFCCYRRNSKKGTYAEGYYEDDKPNSELKHHKQYEDNIVPQNNYSEGQAGIKFEDDQHSYSSSKERNDGKASDIDSQHYRGDQRDQYRGSRDRLDDQRDRYGGSREHLDDKRNYSGSRDRLEDQRDRYGSRDRLDDKRNYSGSRDRLDDQRDRYGGSRDRLDDQRDRYGGSRDRLDDQRDRYGSRDRLDDQRNRYGSRDRLDDRHDRYGGSRDRLDYSDDQYRNRYE